MIIDAPPTKEVHGNKSRVNFVRDFCYKEENTKFDNTNGDKIAEMFKYKVDPTSVFNNYSVQVLTKIMTIFGNTGQAGQTIIGSVI